MPTAPAAESGTGPAAAGKTPETSSASIPRPLAPPEVGGSFLSDDEEDVEESDIEEEARGEQDQEGLAAAVEDLLGEVEVRARLYIFFWRRVFFFFSRVGRWPLCTLLLSCWLCLLPCLPYLRLLLVGMLKRDPQTTCTPSCSTVERGAI